MIKAGFTISGERILDGRVCADLLQALEEGVLEALVGGRPLLRLPEQHRLNQLDALAVGVRYELAQVDLGAAVPLEVELGRQGLALGPLLPARRAQDCADLEELVDLAAAGEQGPQRVALGGDAADRPDVYRRVVACGAEENLWRAVPVEL